MLLTDFYVHGLLPRADTSDKVADLQTRLIQYFALVDSTWKIDVAVTQSVLAAVPVSTRDPIQLLPFAKTLIFSRHSVCNDDTLQIS